MNQRNVYPRAKAHDWVMLVTLCIAGSGIGCVEVSDREENDAEITVVAEDTAADEGVRSAAVSAAPAAGLPLTPFALTNCQGFAAYDVIFLGDSNTHLIYFSAGQKYIAGGVTKTATAADQLRFSEIVASSNRLRISNEGVGGAVTSDYLPGGQHFARWTTKKLASTYVISFGLNDAKFAVTQQKFRENTAALVREVQDRGGKPVLLTSIGLGSKTGPWGAGMNTTMKMYNDVYREFRAQGIVVVDVTAAGIAGDFTVRNTTPYTVDATGDAGKPVSYFANVHYNLAGARYVAQQLAAALPKFAEDAWTPLGKLGGLSITIDDNQAQDHAFWSALGSAQGVRFTWFVITSKVQAIRNAAAATWGVWDDFRKLATGGHEIGSHSHLHQVSVADIAGDMNTASSIITREIGKAPVTFAYPDPAADTQNRWKPVVEAMPFVATRGTVGRLVTTKRNANSHSNAAGVNLDAVMKTHGWAVVHFHKITPELQTAVTNLVAQAACKGLWVAPFGTVAAKFPR